MFLLCSAYVHLPRLPLQPFHFNATYTQGWASGTIEFGNITLGSLQVSNQIFGYATNSERVGLSAFRSSGMLGLCFRKVANVHFSAPVLLENILSAFDEEDRYFAFSLGGPRGLNSISI
ncbi:hypothetical protein M422DRAFT_779338, partial [Sphaerobolus stellatus SS14]